MDDLTIKRDVEAELQWEPSISAAAIGMAVKDGIVTLTGQVPTLAERYAAGRATSRVAGVQTMVNELEVGVLPADQRGDEEIARTAAKVFELLFSDWGHAGASQRRAGASGSAPWAAPDMGLILEQVCCWQVTVGGGQHIGWLL